MVKRTNLQSKWRLILNEIQKGFPSPWQEIEQDQYFENTLKDSISKTNKLKHQRVYKEQKAFKGYLGEPDLPDYSNCHTYRMDKNFLSHEEVVNHLIGYFNGLPNWNHPFTMCNVNPPSHTASIIAGSLGCLFNPDGIEGEYSWNVVKTELESGAMLADLMGWNPEESGGVYTFGGTFSYLYALKLALTTVLGINSRESGIRVNGQVLVAKSGHHAKHTTADWTGLGMNNVQEIAVNADNQMDMQDLKRVMQKCKDAGEPIVMIVCTMGTTDAFAIDPIYEVRQLIDSYENALGYPKPFLYADAVIGWNWMTFKTYDFEKNPLEFSEKGLQVIKKNYEQVSMLTYADAMGIDFHKTGWTPLNCTFFLVKDYQKFTSLLSHSLPPYLQFLTSYNPFIFTLESTRGCTAALMGWSSLKFFGYEGFQVMLGRIVEVAIYFRDLLEKEKSMVCVNANNYGFVTLFRVYPRNINGKEQYKKELTDPSFREDLIIYNKFQQLVAKKLFVMLRDANQKVVGWENAPHTSFTQGCRTPIYSPEETQTECLVHALKAFPMSPFTSEISMLLLRNYVLKARDLVMDEFYKEYPKKAYTDFSEVEKKTIIDTPYAPEEDLKIHLLEDYLLKKIPLFSQLNLNQITELVKRAERKTVEKGVLLFQEGEKADKIFVILNGEVCVFKLTLTGEEITLATLKKGEIFGEMALFETGVRSAAVKTTKSSEFLVIKGIDCINFLM